MYPCMGMGGPPPIPAPCEARRATWLIPGAHSEPVTANHLEGAPPRLAEVRNIRCVRRAVFLGLDDPAKPPPPPCASLSD